MIIGVPAEVKNHEYRVGLVPAGVRVLTGAGHTVLVQQGAGLGSGLTDAEYVAAGATLVADADAVWGEAGMICKVKEPVPQEYGRIQRGQTIYTYLHLAAEPELTQVLLEREATGVAYETIQMPDGTLPLLEPMSEVAGKMAAQACAQMLTKEAGGKGLLLGGVPGVGRGKVVIIGGGTVGYNAAKVAVGLGARVTILDINVRRLTWLEDVFLGKLDTMYSDTESVAELVSQADAVVGAVLVAGARAPTLVSREVVARMEPGSVIVDVAVDQGGCVETVRPTTHEQPTYVAEGVVHYCVSNMPGAVARTSTFALHNATRRYALALAELGAEQACRQDPVLKGGLNTWRGAVTHRAVAESLSLPFKPFG
ncbi:MAG: alanine dehydrogenase [Myxococcales bacterium]|nr:alanine dehydrogenase [Myxococcales bacterium]MCB9524677.1 alanine dehydrogenase [Myxococcales bacterium]